MTLYFFLRMLAETRLISPIVSERNFQGTAAVFKKKETVRQMH